MSKTTNDEPPRGSTDVVVREAPSAEQQGDRERHPVVASASQPPSNLESRRGRGRGLNPKATVSALLHVIPGYSIWHSYKEAERSVDREERLREFEVNVDRRLEELEGRGRIDRSYFDSKDYLEVFLRVAEKAVQEGIHEKRAAYARMVAGIAQPIGDRDEICVLVRALDKLGLIHLRVLEGLKPEELVPVEGLAGRVFNDIGRATELFDGFRGVGEDVVGKWESEATVVLDRLQRSFPEVVDIGSGIELLWIADAETPKSGLRRRAALSAWWRSIRPEVRAIAAVRVSRASEWLQSHGLASLVDRRGIVITPLGARLSAWLDARSPGDSASESTQTLRM